MQLVRNSKRIPQNKYRTTWLYLGNTRKSYFISVGFRAQSIFEKLEEELKQNSFLMMLQNYNSYYLFKNLFHAIYRLDQMCLLGTKEENIPWRQFLPRLESNLFWSLTKLSGRMKAFIPAVWAILLAVMHRLLK